MARKPDPSPAQPLIRSTTLARILRFAGVGAVSALVYAALVYGFVDHAGLAPTWASGLAYIALLPVNFACQKYFVFRSANPPAREAGRYLFTHATSFFVSMAVMHVVTQVFGFSHQIGSFAVIVAVACFSLLVMQVWVFARNARI